MAKKDHFLQQLQKRRQMHVAQTPSHVDKPSEKTMEQLEAELKRAQLEKTKAEAHYWEDKRQANAGAAAGAADEPAFGFASNKKKYGTTRFVLPKVSRKPRWK
jgi:hypothetical protein